MTVRWAKNLNGLRHSWNICSINIKDTERTCAPNIYLWLYFRMHWTLLDRVSTFHNFNRYAQNGPFRRMNVRFCHKKCCIFRLRLYRREWEDFIHSETFLWVPISRLFTSNARTINLLVNVLQFIFGLRIGLIRIRPIK